MTESMGTEKRRQDDQSVSHPPYMSFKSFRGLLDEMGDRGVPARVDRSFLQHKSGSIQSQLLTGLRALGLIDEDKVPADRLRVMAEQPDERPQVLREIVEEYYARPLGMQQGTRQQLEEWFRSEGLSGATVDKGIAFFVQAADFAGLEISPHFRAQGPKRSGSRKTNSGQSGRKRRVKREGEVQGQGAERQREPEPPEDDPMEMRKARYLDVLIKKIEESEDPDERLLDRVERIFQFPESPASDADSERADRSGA